MNYRCPKCSEKLSLRKLFFSDVSECAHCGQKVVLGDFFALFMSSVSLLVVTLSSIYLLTHELGDPYVAGALSVSIGMIFSMVVMVLLGRAKAHMSMRERAAPQA